MIYKKLVFNYDDKKMMRPHYNNEGKEVYKTVERQYVYDINRKFETEFKENDKNVFIAVYEVNENELSIICAYRPEKIKTQDYIKIINSFINVNELISEEEITNSLFYVHLCKANGNDMLNKSPNRWLDDLEANISNREGMFERPYFLIKEELYEQKLPSYKESMNNAEKILASKTLKDELKRIYSKENEKAFYGHPVHYYISSGTWDAAKDIVDVLVPALLKNNRLESKRVTFVNNISSNVNRFDNYRNIFSSSDGSVVVVDLSGNLSFGNFATGYQKNAQQLGEFLAEFGKNTLFIFVEVVGNTPFKDDNIAAIVGNGDIVKIEEGFGDLNRAKSYLDDLVDKSNFAQYKEDDMEKYLEDKLTYSVSDVYAAFVKWYGRGLKSHVYKAYKEFERVKIEKKKVETKPYQKLKEMVGLKDIKDVVNQIIAYEKMQVHRKSMGLSDAKTARHMLFYGEPGTAKTTVARLLGQILKEEGALDVGHVVECGRQDLVGQYVGWTAKIVEDKFKEARGGILLIDEAYSLSEDKYYGREAINTIVQLMENYKDEVIVILAGYPDKMEEFISSNNGLRSRIAFQLNFPNYDSYELMGILDIMLKEKEYSMSDEAKEKCLDLFDYAMNIPNYGNGRFVRNLLEQIELKQSVRIANEYKDEEVDKEIIKQLEVDDVPDNYNFLISNNTNNKIGLIA